MDPKFLKELIQSADLPPNAAQQDAVAIAAGVRSLHRRCRRWQAAGVCAAIVCVGAAIAIGLPHFHQDKTIAHAGHSPTAKLAVVDAKTARAALARTMAEIDREQQVVDALLQAERLDRLESKKIQLAAQTHAALSRDEQIAPVAASYLVSGDEKRQIGLPLASAKADYMRVVELFPGTVWAERAKARLAAIER
jgi:hypothetical protein